MDSGVCCFVMVTFPKRWTNSNPHGGPNNRSINPKTWVWGYPRPAVNAASIPGHDSGTARPRGRVVLVVDAARYRSDAPAGSEAVVTPGPEGMSRCTATPVMAFLPAQSFCSPALVVEPRVARQRHARDAPENFSGHSEYAICKLQNARPTSGLDVQWCRPRLMRDSSKNRLSTRF
jgi:hypothetical protein